jgi:hypothetical protein
MKTIAILLYGPHLAGNDIDQDESEMLQTLAMRAASGYERVFTHLLQQEVATLKTQLAKLQRGTQQSR